MRLSIRKQFSLIFIGLVTGIVMLCLIINKVFLEDYYLRTKIFVIINAYESIRQAANSDSYASDTFMDELEKVCSKYNITVCVMDAYSQTKYVSKNGGQQLESRLVKYIFGFTDDTARVIQEGEDYTIQRCGISGDEDIEMYGRLNSGISFIMSTPVESIKESARLANRFYAYIGFIGAAICGIIIWIITGRITKPIKELSDISAKMVDLDFEAKYKGGGHYEIDVLGENINKLSYSLEKSISELKTANNELKKDILHKEEIDEMRKEFLSNVSHELKTPIALIQGYAEGLKEGVNDDSESREFYCDVIMDEASKMNVMVKKLLTLNQLEFGNDIVSLERFDITSLIQNYLQSADILAKQSGISVRMADYGPIYVWADEFKIEEVFTNYFTNAIHHCDFEKLIDIKISENNGRVRVSVFNTGKPIPEDSIAHIWDKFYKVDKARTREYGGSGVGLSIVKVIMESMNQEYGVVNYSNGVMFYFDIETVENGKDMSMGD